MNIKLTICYDGTDFLGWQIQKKGRTVQEEVEKYLTFSNLYLNKETLAIDSLISDDDNYQNKYLIKLNQDVYFYFNETIRCKYGYLFRIRC